MNNRIYTKEMFDKYIKELQERIARKRKLRIKKLNRILK